MTELILKCYCCGMVLDGSVALVSMGEGAVDRVFAFHPDHVRRAQDAIATIVRRTHEKVDYGP